ncbi:MscL family protein [Cycloclasticus sp. P1]|uniref:MscL family protein n=1 Tax=Cycloclasticus sp. (strain P1) TaxID=385025 RepID=UPI001930A1BA
MNYFFSSLFKKLSAKYLLRSLNTLVFIYTVVDFIIIAFTIFMVVKAINSTKINGAYQC